MWSIRIDISEITMRWAEAGREESSRLTQHCSTWRYQQVICSTSHFPKGLSAC